MDLANYAKFHSWLGLQEHPLVVYYTDRRPEGGISPKEGAQACMIGLLGKARRGGETVFFDAEHSGCFGGAYYMGFREQARPKIEYFLSCGIPGEMEGERYIKTPELAREYFAAAKPRRAPGKYCVFKPLDGMQPGEEAEVVVFFVPPDILSGLFTLTNYAAGRMDAVRVPFSSGCGSLLTYPLKEAEEENPRAVLGMLDVSARPFVEPHILTLAMPLKLFKTILDNLDESFLITGSWKKVRERIDRAGSAQGKSAGAEENAREP